jgi:hypothetical protein
MPYPQSEGLQSCVGKILFTINEIGEGFLASPATPERG